MNLGKRWGGFLERQNRDICEVGLFMLHHFTLCLSYPPPWVKLVQSLYWMSWFPRKESSYNLPYSCQVKSWVHIITIPTNPSPSLPLHVSPTHPPSSRMLMLMLMLMLNVNVYPTLTFHKGTERLTQGNSCGDSSSVNPKWNPGKHYHQHGWEIGLQDKEENMPP